MRKLAQFTTLVALSVSSFFTLDGFADDKVIEPAAKVQDDWYLHMDISAMRNSLLGKRFEGEQADARNALYEIFGKDLSERVEYISVRGQLEKDDSKTLLIQGKFAEPSVQANLREKLKEIGFKSIDKSKVLLAEEKDIEQFLAATVKKLEEKGFITNDENKEIKVEIHKEDSNIGNIYLGFKSDNVLVLSESQNTVEQWLTEKKQWQPKNNSQVFEVVVDIQKSLMHGGVNIDSEAQNFEFESISAKQLSQLSATYSEDNGTIDIEVGLKTDSFETASQIEAVVRGLVALKMLSSSTPEANRLLQSMIFERNNDSLRLVLSGPIQSFEALSKEL